MNPDINRIVIEVFNAFAAEIKGIAKEPLGANGLAHIVPETEIIASKKGATLVFKLPGYTIFVEHGVKGTESTPAGAETSSYSYKHLGVSKDMLGNISQWARRKGLSPKTKKTSLNKTNTRRKLKESNSNPETSMAFAIAKSVKKRGLSAKKIIANTLTSERLQALTNTIGKKIEKDVLLHLQKAN
jgi:hypothetical protein